MLPLVVGDRRRLAARPGMTGCAGRRSCPLAQSQAGRTSRTGRFRRTLDPVWIDGTLSEQGQGWRKKRGRYDRNRCNGRHDSWHGLRRATELLARGVAVVRGGIWCARGPLQQRCDHDRAFGPARMTDKRCRRHAHAERHHDAEQACDHPAKATTHWATQRCERARRTERVAAETISSS